MSEASCRTCQHFDPPKDKLGRSRVRRDNAYRCNAPIPVFVVPLSFRDIRNAMSRARKEFMMPDQTGCPAHQPLAK